jgi:hypothetical protein
MLDAAFSRVPCVVARIRKDYVGDRKETFR